MRKLTSVWLVTAIVTGVFAVVIFAHPLYVRALGPAAVNLLSSGGFAVLSKTGVTNVPTSDVTGNVGASPITGAAIGIPCSEVTGTIYSTNSAGPLPCRINNPSLLTTAVSDMEAAYTDAAGRTLPDTTEFMAGNLGGQVIAPGLHKWSTAVTIPTDLTLSGGANDVWIFQIAGDLTISSATDIVLIGGAQASNIFWQVGGLTGATLGTTSIFNGTILSSKQIIMQTGATLNGRALAQTQVVLDGNTIALPVGVADGDIHIIKQVVNDNNGTAVVTDFDISVKLSGVTHVVGSPAIGAIAPGTLYTLAAGTYVVSEDTDPLYTQSFSGDCSAGGVITLLPGDNLTCTVINNDRSPSGSSHSGGTTTRRVVNTFFTNNQTTTSASNTTNVVTTTNSTSPSTLIPLFPKTGFATPWLLFSQCK